MSSIPARPASTVVLLRPADPFEVFLVRRSDSIAFMGGAHVFPGGRVDDDDRLDDIDALSVGSEAAAARMSDVPGDVAVAHHVAAVRELFEEAGVLLARPLDAASMSMLAPCARRARLFCALGDAGNRDATVRYAFLRGESTVRANAGARCWRDESQ
jgi:8-oxo-dGTP pyrophosphatase MutT (NUDIX family)